MCYLQPAHIIIVVAVTANKETHMNVCELANEQHIAHPAPCTTARFAEERE